jgi:hypothetical protein
MLENHKKTTWNSPHSRLVTSVGSWQCRRKRACLMYEKTAKKNYEEFLVLWVADFAEDGTSLVCRSVVLVRVNWPFLFLCFLSRPYLELTRARWSEKYLFRGGVLNGVYKPELMTQDHQQFTHQHEEETVDIAGKDPSFNTGHRNYSQIFLISLLRLVQNTVNINPFQFVFFVH